MARKGDTSDEVTRDHLSKGPGPPAPAPRSQSLRPPAPRTAPSPPSQDLYKITFWISFSLFFLFVLEIQGAFNRGLMIGGMTHWFGLWVDHSIYHGINSRLTTNH